MPGPSSANVATRVTSAGRPSLRKVIWTVPGFTVAGHRERLLDLHRQIESEGPFVAHSSRHLIEARKRA